MWTGIEWILAINMLQWRRNFSVVFSFVFPLFIFFLTKMCLVKPLFYKFGEEFILMSKFWDSDGMQHWPSRDLFI